MHRGASTTLYQRQTSRISCTAAAVYCCTRRFNSTAGSSWLTGVSPPLPSFSSCSLASFHIPFTPHSFIRSTLSLPTTGIAIPSWVSAAHANRGDRRRCDRCLSSVNRCSIRSLATGGVADPEVEVGLQPPCCCPPVRNAMCTHPSARSGLSARRASERSNADALSLIPRRRRCCWCLCW